MLSPERRALSPLRARLAELSDLVQARYVMGWDQQTMMPPHGAAARGEATGTLEQLIHERSTDPELAGLLTLAVEADDPVDAPVARVVLEDYERARRIPAELVADLARAGVTGQAAWMEARAANDATLFLPALQRNLDLRRRMADCFPEFDHPYDALLEDYEPGLTTADLTAVFGRLRAGLVPLIAEVRERLQPPVLAGPFDVEAQRAFALRIAGSFGFEPDVWRLDLAEHPFAVKVSPGDVRVTARFEEDSLTGIFAVMHEVGHGLYDLQVDPALDRTPASGGTSLGVHESQSRLWENFVGRSRPFWAHWYPELQATFPDALGGFDLDTFHRAVNAVRPGLIRVAADEATYSLHIVLRFELEVALVEGTLAVADLPEAWRVKTRELLGLEVPDDRAGVLQDIHWAEGMFGYFPTYAIGNMVAAQLWTAIRAHVPDLDDQLAAGEVGAVREWLREHVHRFGRTRRPAELLRTATGSDLDPGPFLAYLRSHLGGLHGL